MDERAVIDAARGIVDYWGGRNNRLVYGVLLQRVLIRNKRRSYDRKKKLTMALLMGKRVAIGIRPEIIKILGT